MRYGLLLSLVLLPVLAHADILHMADGSTREGRVIEENDQEITVDFGKGSMALRVTLPRSDVVRIERKISPNAVLMTEYVRRLGKAVRGGAEDWYALGLWCREQRCLNDKAQEAFERAVAVDPDHAAAHTALGHVKLNDAWMPRKEALRLLAPDLVDAEAKARELTAKKEAEEAKTELLEVRKSLEELKARVAELDKENNALRRQLAAASRPRDYDRPRVVYRPIIVVRDPKKKHGARHDAGKDKPPGEKPGDQAPPSEGAAQEPAPKEESQK
jgi:hypothetical protein